jgi:hypothetical protein
MINPTALRHPRTQWEIESAMWRATEYGAAIACTAAGKEIVSIVHDRSQVPAFSFWRGCEDVTGEFLKVLRAQG